MKPGGISWLVNAALLLGVTASVAQPLPCTSVASEVRDYVRSRGACRDVKPASSRPKRSKPAKAAAPAPAPAPPAAANPAEVAVEPPATNGAQASNGAPAEVVGTVPAVAPTAVADTVPVAAAVAAAPPNPVDPPVARSESQAAIPGSVLLIFAAGAALGLLSGALLMRRWLLRSKPEAGESAWLSAPSQKLLPAEIDDPVTDESTTDEPTTDEPTTHEPATLPELRFTAWLVPVATRIVLAPRAGAPASPASAQATDKLEQVRLLAPIEIGVDDIDRALSGRIRSDSEFAQAFGPRRGESAERAAAELTRALDVDIVDVLSQGWVQLPAMSEAVQLSAVTRGPPVLVDVDVPHTIASTSHVVLDARLADRSLQRIELLLEIVADIEGASLAAREGGIEPVALAGATVTARLRSGSALMKEHGTQIAWSPGDPSVSRQPSVERPATVDIPI